MSLLQGNRLASLAARLNAIYFSASRLPNKPLSRSMRSYGSFQSGQSKDTTSSVNNNFSLNRNITKISKRQFSTTHRDVEQHPNRQAMNNALAESARKLTSFWLDQLQLPVIDPTTTDKEQWHVHGSRPSSRTLLVSGTPSDASLNDVPGLYGIRGLHQPLDFQKFIQEQLEEVDICVDLICDPKLKARQVVSILDEISTRLCDITDTLEFCRNAHEEEVWRNIANEAWIQMQEVFAIFSTNKNIAAAIARVCKDKKDFETLTREEQRILDSMNLRVNSFSGVGEDVVEYALKLNDHSLHLDQKYQNNLHNYPYLTLPDTKVRSIVNYAPDLRDSVQQLGPNTIVRLDPYTTSMILSYVPDREIRKVIYSASLKVHVENLPILAEFVASKQLSSQVINFKSFTHLSLLTEVARSPENVVRFLEAFRRYVSPIARQELKKLRLNAEASTKAAHVKRGVNSVLGRLFAFGKEKDKETEEVKPATDSSLAQVEEPLSNGILTRQGRLGPIGEPNSAYEHGLESWDLAYARQLASENMVSAEEYNSYFSYSVCLDALQVLAKEVFSLELIPSPMNPTNAAMGIHSESWTPGTNLFDNENVISKFEICDAVTKEHFGTMYIDLFQRPGKVNGAATFTIRCAKEMTSACSPLAPGETSNDSYRKAVVALVANFQPDFAQVNIGNTTLAPSSMDLSINELYPEYLSHLSPEQRTKWDMFERQMLANNRSLLLSYDRFVTVLHEFGHSLNGILSRTKYQILSGVRYELDFVETPSTFMENFAMEPEFLRRVAKHYLTNEPIPEHFIQAILARVQSERAITILDSTRTAAIDQRLFGVPVGFNPANPFPWVSSKFSSNETPLTIDEMVSELNEVDVQYIADHNPYFEPNSNQKPAVPKGTKLVDLADPKWSYLMGSEGLNVGHQLFNRYSVTPPLDEVVFPQASIAHHMNYSGSYYTYIYCETFSRAIYNKLFSGNPFNQQAGLLFRKHLLATGGSNHPLTNLARVLAVKHSLETEELTVDQQNELFNDVMRNYVAFLLGATPNTSSKL